MFKIGDQVVYPSHGAGTIEGIEEKNSFREKEKLFGHSKCWHRI